MSPSTEAEIDVIETDIIELDRHELDRHEIDTIEIDTDQDQLNKEIMVTRRRSAITVSR